MAFRQFENMVGCLLEQQIESEKLNFFTLNGLFQQSI